MPWYLTAAAVLTVPNRDAAGPTDADLRELGWLAAAWGLPGLVPRVSGRASPGRCIRTCSII